MDVAPADGTREGCRPTGRPDSWREPAEH